MAEYDVVLLPSFAQVEDWRKKGADASACGLFAQTVTTFAAWVADLWELHGDGRAVADSLQRRVIMQAAFGQLAAEQREGFALHVGDGTWVSADVHEGKDAKGDVLTVSKGVVALAASCVRAAVGVPEFECAVDQAEAGQLPAGCTPREAALLQGIARYRALLEDAGLVELGQAAASIAECANQVFPRLLRVLVAEAAPLNWQMAHFFQACGNLHVDVQEAPGAEGVGCGPDGVQVRFGFPSGRYAQPALVADLVCQAIGKGDGAPRTTNAQTTVVTCKDPLALYKQLEIPLAQEGITCCVQAQVPFGATDFGRRFMSLARVVVGDGTQREGGLDDKAYDEDSNTRGVQRQAAGFAIGQREPWQREDLSDAVLPPFSGFGKDKALDIDKGLRADRIARREACLARLRVESETFSQLEELAADPEADILLGVFEQIAFTTPGRSDAWRAEQLGAESALRSCTTAARKIGAGMRTCLDTLEDVKITASFQGVTAHDSVTTSTSARVVITTQAAAAQMGARSCDRLIACDLTEEDYPVADKDDAAATLFGKLGLLPSDTALARARRTFTALQQLPTCELVLLRPLNNWDGNPTYPAVVLQELVDARWPNVRPDDLDETFGLPDQELPAIVQRGEELLYANARAARTTATQLMLQRVKGEDARQVPTPMASAPLKFEDALEGAVSTSSALAFEDAAPPQSAGAQERPAPSASEAAALATAVGHVAPPVKPLMAIPRRAEDGASLGFAPSPSQVEAYLECPYKWFAQNRVRTEQLDEEFGPLQRGSFMHAVLQEFYRRWLAQGGDKVTLATLGQARQVMRQVADQLEEQQRLANPGSGRYVAADQMEWRQLQACKDQLVAFLDFEAALLPRFRPRHLEFSITPEDGVMYAKHPFIGTVDRIDVDDAGNAVIIDYKGSLTSAHEIAGKGPQDPGKVQTRMYAQAVKRLLGLNVVGALYVSYGKSPTCAGAYDGRVLESPHLPNMKHDKCCCFAGSPCNPVGAHSVRPPHEGENVSEDPLCEAQETCEDFSQLSFQDMLDQTEVLVEAAIKGMQDAQVQPNPATPDACSYCVAKHCPMKGA